MKTTWIVLLAVGLPFLFIAVELLYIVRNGTYVPAPEIPRDTTTSGAGRPLNYVVMGDSTSIGQGVDYADSIGPLSVAHLAKQYRVTYTNVGISGATTRDTLVKQVSAATAHKPDLVLLSVGANDATHFKTGSSVHQAMDQITDALIADNCHVKIVLTGSPAMGSVSRLPWPIKQLMGLRARQINHAYAPVIADKQLTFAGLADKTGAAFMHHPEYFAADNFHPNKAGYAIWAPVINAALDQALASQPSHCTN